VKHFHHQHGVQTNRQLRIRCGTEHGPDVAQPFALHPLRQHLHHRPLNVFGVDDAVRPDAARQLHGEPAAAGAQIGDDIAFADLEGVHNQVRLLPLLAIGRLQEAEIGRREQPRVLLLLESASG